MAVLVSNREHPGPGFWRWEAAVCGWRHPRSSSVPSAEVFVRSHRPPPRTTPGGPGGSARHHQTSRGRYGAGTPPGWCGATRAGGSAGTMELTVHSRTAASPRSPVRTVQLHARATLCRWPVSASWLATIPRPRAIRLPETPPRGPPQMARSLRSIMSRWKRPRRPPPDPFGAR